jgi:ABC-type lipoprotein release transport system permease subunit
MVVGVRMPIKFKRKVIDLNKSLVVNIPFEIAQELGIKKGDTITITFENGHFCCRKEEKT